MTTRRLVIAVAIALAVAVGVAAPSSASSSCNGASSCDETLITANNGAQFLLNAFNCISSTDHDVDSVTVLNQESDHARHAYVIQTRRELPSNTLIQEGTIFVDYGHTGAFNFTIPSYPKGDKLYTYVRSGSGVVQRLSVWHTEGDYPTWAQAVALLYSYGTYACI